jgi:Flp pilus assembly pilin Flp
MEEVVQALPDRFGPQLKLEVGMFERMSLKLEELLVGLKSEEGQNTTEYAVVIALVVVTLGAGLSLMGGAIQTFLGEVTTLIGNLIP